MIYSVFEKTQRRAAASCLFTVDLFLPPCYLLARTWLFPSLHLFHHHTTFCAAAEGTVAKTQTQKVKFKLQAHYVQTTKNKQAMNKTTGSTLFVCERLFHGCFQACTGLKGFNATRRRWHSYSDNIIDGVTLEQMGFFFSSRKPHLIKLISLHSTSSVFYR